MGTSDEKENDGVEWSGVESFQAGEKFTA